MCEGPIFVMILEGEESIEGWREVMGATDPAKADDGTIRKRFGESIERNSVHGSDGSETARVEIDFFSKDLELRS
jgi:nucleoside-diphosphate kinase